MCLHACVSGNTSGYSMSQSKQALAKPIGLHQHIKSKTYWPFPRLAFLSESSIPSGNSSPFGCSENSSNERCASGKLCSSFDRGLLFFIVGHNRGSAAELAIQEG